MGRSPFLSDLMVALKMALADTGYHLMLISPKTAADGVNGFVQAAWQHSLDGVLLMGVNEHLPAVEALIRSGRPCVGLDLPVVRQPRLVRHLGQHRRGCRRRRAPVGLGHTPHRHHHRPPRPTDRVGPADRLRQHDGRPRS